MDATTSWIIMGGMLAAGLFFGFRRLKGMQPKQHESAVDYMTRMYGQHFELAAGEKLAYCTPARLYTGPLLESQHRSLGSEVKQAAGQAVATVAAAAIGVRLSHHEATWWVGVTTTDRVLCSVEQGQVGHFVPHSVWTDNAVALSDLEALKQPARGGPPGHWSFMMLADTAGRRLGLWLPADAPQQLAAWIARRRA